MVTQIILNQTQTITLKAGRYTFVPDELGYRQHYGHSIEMPYFGSQWHCHTCEMFFDDATFEEYKDLTAQLARNGSETLLTIDTHATQENWGDY